MKGPDHDKLYSGFPSPNGNDVRVVQAGIAGQPVPMRLNPRLDLANKSPTGFAWGFGGSGSAQLALAILADALQGFDARFEGAGPEGAIQPDRLALALFQEFKREVIQNLAMDEPWAMSRNAVLAIVRGMLQRSDAGKLIERMEGLGLPSNEDGVH
jgi:hypothetical protein